MWPASWITSSVQVPTATVSPSPTRRVTSTPVCSVIASASGSPATTSAPVAATTSASARWWSQCWWVVTTVVSPASADQGEQRLRLGRRVDQHLVAGVAAAQQVAVVGHLRVDRDLGDASGGPARGRRASPPGPHGAGVGHHQPPILGSAPAAARDLVARRPAGQPPAEVGDRAGDDGRVVADRAHLPGAVGVERADQEAARRAAAASPCRRPAPRRTPGGQSSGE